MGSGYFDTAEEANEYMAFDAGEEEVEQFANSESDRHAEWQLWREQDDLDQALALFSSYFCHDIVLINGKTSAQVVKECAEKAGVRVVKA